MADSSRQQVATLQQRIDYLEENRRFTQNCLEMVLGLSDFHKHFGKDNDHHVLLKESLEKFEKIIPFKGCAIYLVDEGTAEFALTFCEPSSLRQEMAAQVEFMIEEGLFGWAIRERRGIFTASDDHTRHFLVHVIANHARIQGMFIGLLPTGKISVPDTSLALLSITLLNLANVMESMRLYQWVKNQNLLLEEKVRERTLKLDRSRLELKQAMSNLEKMASEADAANKAKSQFLANMSHEIRTPLNGIIGCAELMLKSEDLNECRNLAGISLGESEHLLNLINNVLDYSKIEAGKIELEQKPFDLESLLRAVMAGLEIQARAKGLELELQIEGKPWFAVKGDALRLRQVLINLVNNAVKFTPAGKVTLRLDRTAAGAPRNQQLTFSVIDTGIGIPADRQEAIFSRFTQADQSTTRRYGGTGLGTAIACQLVALMGGKMALESTPGHGSTFSFTIILPLADPEDLPGAVGLDNPADNQRASDNFGRPLRILVAEDTPVNQMVIRRHLEVQGCNVVIADHGLAAVEACRRQQFDLILMDIQMPVMDGLEATRVILREMPAEAMMPIAALTANADIQTRAACEAAGMTGVLTKPIRRQALLKAVHDLTDRSRQPAPDRPAGSCSNPAQIPTGQCCRLESLPFDLETAVYEFGGCNLVRQVIDQLISNGAAQLDDIRGALARRQWDVVKRTAHAIKGGAATAEAMPLSRAAAQLEARCRGGDMGVISRSVEHLEAAWRELKNYAEAMEWPEENK